jgi:hypothetical protein
MPTATAPHSSQHREPSHSQGRGPARRPAPRGADASLRGKPASRWPLERILFLMAGTMTGLSALLSALVTPWFLLLTAFVAVNQLAFVALGNCPSSWVLQRYLGVQRASCR